MKFFTLFVFVAVFSALTFAENPLCIICKPYISVPVNWEGAQKFLRIGCIKIGSAKDACLGLVNAADLTDSYKNMYPHLQKLREIGCQKFCSK